MTSKKSGYKRYQSLSQTKKKTRWKTINVTTNKLICVIAMTEESSHKKQINFLNKLKTTAWRIDGRTATGSVAEGWCWLGWYLIIIILLLLGVILTTVIETGIDQTKDNRSHKNLSVPYRNEPNRTEPLSLCNQPSIYCGDIKFFYGSQQQITIPIYAIFRRRQRQQHYQKVIKKSNKRRFTTVARVVSEWVSGDMVRTGMATWWWSYIITNTTTNIIIIITTHYLLNMGGPLVGNILVLLERQ